MGKRLARKAKEYGGAVNYARWNVQRIFMVNMDVGGIPEAPGLIPFSL